MGRGAETRKSVVDKHVCFRDDGGHYDRHANRTALCAFQKEFQDSWLHLPIKQDKRKITWKKECKVQTRLGGGMLQFTEVKTCRGGQSVGEKWSTSKSVFCFGSENWSWSQAIFDRNIKGGKQKAMRRSFRIKKNKRRRNMGYCQGTARAARTIWTKMKHVESYGLGL